MKKRINSLKVSLVGPTLKKKRLPSIIYESVPCNLPNDAVDGIETFRLKWHEKINDLKKGKKCHLLC